jgi:hypothetical protein
LLVTQQSAGVPTTYVKRLAKTVFMYRTHDVYVNNTKVATRGGERRGGEEEQLESDELLLELDSLGSLR